MSKFEVSVPEFQRNKLTVEIESFFKGPVIKLDGKTVQLKRNKATVKDDLWTDRQIQLVNKFYDLPSVKVDGVDYFPMGKFKVIEQVVVGLPIGLLAIGGAIGGGLGAFGAYTNSLIMRDFKDESFKKYALCLFTSVVCFIIWYMAAVMINSMMGRR